MIIRHANRIPVFALTALAVTLLLLLTLLPSGSVPPPPGFLFADKLAHAVMFGLVTAVALWDWSRNSGCLDRRNYIIVAIAATLAGGVIELLQWKMDIGRSGDWADWLADAIGAFGIPAALWPLISRAVSRYLCDVRILPAATIDSLQFAKPLYFNSFPPEERRDWIQLATLLRDAHSPAKLGIISSRNRPVGFITLWELGECVYVEHFAIAPQARSGGIGAKALQRVIGAVSRPIVLEVELPDAGPDARRRIAFYERNSLTPFPEWNYIQPPYSPGLPEVPLMLMSTDPQLDLDAATRAIHTKVYTV